jgi:solute carrier family 25 phosphate transporter 3
LEYDQDLGRFVLSAGDNVVTVNGATGSASGLPLDPEFGPRGRSPIERDLTLDLPSFLRFCASGAICASGAHLILTPLDVVKTKIQTDPENYPGVFAAFKKLTRDAGPAGFFAGWVPTTIGFFCWGGFSYSVTELLRRYFNDMLGDQAATLEVPVIVTAAAISSFFSVFILCPFEAVRIRSVAQPGYGKNVVDMTTRMIAVSLDDGSG